jgi:predicted GIY-YIG superfamily endonuclease
MSIKKLLTQYDIPINDDNEVSLRVFLCIFEMDNDEKNRLIHKARVSSVEYHVRKHGSEYMIHTWDLCRYIHNRVNEKIKTFYKSHKDIIDANKIDPLCNTIDIHDKKFIYQGTNIDLHYLNDKWYVPITIIRKMSKIDSHKIIPLEKIDNKDCIDITLIKSFLDIKLKTSSLKRDLFMEWVQNVIKCINGVNIHKGIISKINDVDLDDYNNNYIMYILRVRNGTYKYGDTYDIKERMKKHRASFKTYDYIRLYKFDDFRQMKNMSAKLKELTKTHKISYVDSDKRIEMFKSNANMNAVDFINIIDDAYQIYNKPIATKQETNIFYKTIDVLTREIGYEKSLSLLNNHMFTDTEFEYIREIMNKHL